VIRLWIASNDIVLNKKVSSNNLRKDRFNNNCVTSHAKYYLAMRFNGKICLYNFGKSKRIYRWYDWLQAFPFINFRYYYTFFSKSFLSPSRYLFSERYLKTNFPLKVAAHSVMGYERKIMLIWIQEYGWKSKERDTISQIIKTFILYVLLKEGISCCSLKKKFV